jgi:hypothetical protein
VQAMALAAVGAAVVAGVHATNFRHRVVRSASRRPVHRSAADPLC